MTARSSPPGRQRTDRVSMTARLRAALRAVEAPECDCKFPVTPVCLIGALPGCRERRQTGACPCRLRILPACQIDHPGGCVLRREGKSCTCERRKMAECLSPGCSLRRRGRLCECPRWPGHPCRHMTAYAERMRMVGAAVLLSRAMQADGSLDSGWATLLWHLWPRQYRGATELGCPAVLIDRATRVTMMALRRTFRLQLWHPGDIRRPPSGDGERTRQCVRSFVRLFSSPTEANP